MTKENKHKPSSEKADFSFLSGLIPLRFLPAALLALGLILAISLDFHHILTLENLREHHLYLIDFINKNKLLALFLFCVSYILIVAISLPGASFLTLSAGYLFGTFYGGMAAHFSATIGACLIFLATRTALGNWLKGRTGSFLKKIELGFKRDEYSYLLIFRLLPLYPFFIMNLAPAFLGARIKVFIITTFIGIIPGTYILASLGRGLGLILEKGGIFRTDFLSDPEIYLPLSGAILLISGHMVYKRQKNRTLKNREVKNHELKNNTLKDNKLKNHKLAKIDEPGN